MGDCPSYHSLPLIISPAKVLENKGERGWQRQTKKKELEERNKRRAESWLLLSAICERLKQSWKVVLFLSQNVGMVLFLGGNLMICKTIWICNWRCYFYFIYLSDWTPFPLIVLLRIRAIAFFRQCTKYFMVGIKNKGQGHLKLIKQMCIYKLRWEFTWLEI